MENQTKLTYLGVYLQKAFMSFARQEFSTINKVIGKIFLAISFSIITVFYEQSMKAITWIILVNNYMMPKIFASITVAIFISRFGLATIMIIDFIIFMVKYLFKAIIKSIPTFKPINKTIKPGIIFEGVDADKLINYLLEHKTFKQHEVKDAFNITIPAFKQLSTKLDNEGVFNKGYGNARILGMNQEELAKVIYNKKEEPILTTRKASRGKEEIHIGKTDTGEINKSLSELPHMLIAGGSGLGKSTALHSMITSLGNDVDWLMIDPKEMELNIYQDNLPLIKPIIYDIPEATRTLEEMVELMGERNKIIAGEFCRNIDEYRAKGNKMRRIVMIIDELADLMDEKEYKDQVEQSIHKLTRKGRACGMHLILSTQRPSTKVLTGDITSNIPSRLCFGFPKVADSMVVLGKPGAEDLKEVGKAIFKSLDVDMAEVRTPYISNDEVLKKLQTA